MSLATETRAAYRSILRELARSVRLFLPIYLHYLAADEVFPSQTQSIHPRTERNKAITQSVRVLFEEASKTASAAPESKSATAKEAADKLLRDARNAVTFLRAQRIHKV